MQCIKLTQMSGVSMSERHTLQNVAVSFSAIWLVHWTKPAQASIASLLGGASLLLLGLHVSTPKIVAFIHQTLNAQQ